MLPRIKCDTSSRELGNLSQSQQSGKYGDTNDRHDLFTPNHSRSAFAHDSHDGLVHARRVGASHRNFQPHRIQQLGPLRARALPRSESRHHGQVHLGRLPVHARVREDHFVEQDGGIGTHGCDDVLENLAAFMVGPVVEDGAEVVEFGPCAVVREVC